MKYDHIDFDEIMKQVSEDVGFDEFQSIESIALCMELAIQTDRMSRWIPVSERPPEPIEGNKVLGFNGDYMFECEYEDGIWCNIGGESMTHWQPITYPQQAKPEAE